jgi:hypothetical protein
MIIETIQEVDAIGVHESTLKINFLYFTYKIKTFSRIVQVCD